MSPTQRVDNPLHRIRPGAVPVSLLLDTVIPVQYIYRKFGNVLFLIKMGTYLQWSQALSLEEYFSSFGNFMRIIAKKTLRAFWNRHPDAERPLLAWYREVKKEDWEAPARIKEKYGKASIIGGNRVVFDIKGNSYRLVAEVDYSHRTVRIRFIGTHDQYAGIDAKRI